MKPGSAAPIWVIGLGCRQGCSVDELLTLIEHSLRQAGVAISDLSAMASLDRKADEPGLMQLAEHLNLEFEVFSAKQLVPFVSRLSHRSEQAFEHTGCWGIAESSALALAEHLSGAPATLLITRQRSPKATFALACAEQIARSSPASL